MKLLTISINTFKEAIRDKILYNLMFFALILICLSILLATLSIGEQSRIIIDMGLASINIFGVLIAIFLGIGLISKEIEKRTIYTIISKPVRRHEFLLGKYCGLIITLVVNTLIMAAGLYLVLMFNEWRWGHNVLNINPYLWKGVWLIFIEFMVMTAVAMMFSTFTSSSTLSAIFTLSIYIVGHLTPDLKGLAGKSGNHLAKSVLDIFYYILPNLENFNIKGEVVHLIEVGSERMLLSTLYGLSYVVVLLLLSVVIFQRRDFK